MMNGRTLIDTFDERELNIEKFNKTIKISKGYFVFLGVKEGRKVIFKFNLEVFRKNYRNIDLIRMDLLIYGVQVGKASLNQLNCNEEIKLEPNKEEQSKFFKLDNIKDEEKDRIYIKLNKKDLPIEILIAITSDAILGRNKFTDINCKWSL